MKFLSIIVSLLILSLINCGAPGFQIVQIEDEFSDPKAPSTIVGQNNRLSSKSAQGSTHIDSKGVFLNPYVVKDKSSHEILDVGFYIVHHTFDLSGGFRSIREIIFITDNNKRIILKVRGQDIEYDVSSWNVVSTEFSSTFSEYGIGTLQKAEFIKILTSGSLNVEIIGDNLQQTYNDDELSRSFISNLNSFYNTEIKVNNSTDTK
jgi:hypothetical protein